MKQMIKKSLSIILLISAFMVNAAQVPIVTGASPVVSLFKIRPQSLNGARKVAGEIPGEITHVTDECVWLSNFSLTPAYQKTFDPKVITRTLFNGYLQKSPTAAAANTNNAKKCNTSCRESILIQGTGVEGRNPNAWRAEDFYLSSTYDGALSFNPTISNVMLDFNFYGELNQWAQGLYFRVYAPFVHTKWHLNMKETIKTAGDTTEFDKPFGTASAYFSGATPPPMTLKGSIQSVPAGTPSTPMTFGVTRNPLEFNKMMSSDQCAPKCTDNINTRNGFGEIRGEFGWDFWRGANHHIGAYIAAAAPTGTTPNAQFLFEPLIGNGKHWELGAGATGHWTFWKNQCEDHRISMNFDTLITHLFASKQCRTFDLKNKSLSRYMKAAKMDAAATNRLSGVTPPEPVTTPAAIQFANEFTPIANLTTQQVNVSVGAQVDLTAWFNYTGKNFTIDLGYNLWLQTCEKFKCTSQYKPRLATEKDTWVLVGDATAYGINSGDLTPDSFFQPLSFSESTATITTATGNTTGSNVNIDNPQPAGAINPINGSPAGGIWTLYSPSGRVDTSLSLPPVFINAADIDMNQRAKALSNKFFANIGYTWDREENMIVFNIGGEVEFGSGKNCPKKATTTTTNNNNKKNCTSCINNAVSQWGIWSKFEIAFN